MMRLLKKIINFEPLIIWCRYFLTVKIHNVIMNFIIPLIISALYYFWCENLIKDIPFDVFTISSILVGFCSSILIMLFTYEGTNFNKIKEIKLANNNVSLHKALVYKFSFITINLISLMFVEIISIFFNFNDCIIYKAYILFVLINTIFTLIEALTNVAFCLVK